MQRLRIKQDDTGKVKIVDEETGLSLEDALDLLEEIYDELEKKGDKE